MKTLFRGIVIGVGGILVVGGLGVVFGVSQLNGWTRKGLEHQLTRIMGAPVEIATITVHPFQKTLEMHKLTVFNPDPFVEGAAIHLPEIRVVFEPLRLFRDPLTLPEIAIDNAELHLRYLPGTGTNIQTLSANAQRWHESPRLFLGRRAFVIERLESRGATLTAHALGRSVTIPLGDIARREVGSEQVRSAGYMSALVLRSLLADMVATAPVIKGLHDLLGAEVEKWMGEIPI
jgi:hypothetical protein